MFHIRGPKGEDIPDGHGIINICRIRNRKVIIQSNGTVYEYDGPSNRFDIVPLPGNLVEYSLTQEELEADSCQ